MIMSKKTRQLILKWQRTKAMLDRCKARESDLRDQIVDDVFSERTEGTNSAELGHGYEIKCKQPYSYNVDEDELKNVLKEMPRGAKKKLIKTKVSLIKKGYSALDEEDKEIFDPCLTLTPGKPQLEIVAPKKEETS